MQASPSKARAQAIETHSWSLVLSWLSDLYHPFPVPGFERNATTLKALQNLKAGHDAAERTQELLFDARIEELAVENRDVTRNQARTGNDTDSLLQLLESCLSASSKRALDSLANSAVLLGCPPATISPSSPLQNLQSQVLNLPRQTFSLESQLCSIESLTSNLQNQIDHTHQALYAFTKPSDPDSISPPTTPPSTNDHSTLHTLTLQHQRETKQLLLKSAEYKERIASLERQSASRASSSSPTLADLAVKVETLDRKKTKVEALENKILVFHGLPPDVEASRTEVKRAQAELDALKRKRDELFARMGE